MIRDLYPTQISTARRCWRRWAAKYHPRLKVRVERWHPYAAGLGDEVHDLHERYNKLGQTPVPDRSVADNLLIAGLPYLPAPRIGVTEEEGRLTMNGVSYAMRRDWKGMLSDLPQVDGLRADFGDVPAQLDLKTSSQPMRYGLWSREQFLDDTQLVLEGLELSVASNSDVVASRWLYFQTPKKNEDGTYKLRGKVDAFPSDIVLGRDALGRAHLKIVEPFAKGIHELLQDDRIQDFRQLPHPDDWADSRSACHDYKGCDYQGLCAGTFRSPDKASVERMVSAGYGPAVGEKDMSLFPPLAQQLAAGHGVAPQAPAAVVPPVVPPVAPTVAPTAPPVPVAAPTAPAVPVSVPAVPSVATVAVPAVPVMVPTAPGFSGINAPELTKPAPIAAPVAAPVAAPIVVPAAMPEDRTLTKADVIAALEAFLAVLKK